MADIMEYIFGGTLSLLVLFMLTPTIVNFLSSALDAVANATGLSSTQQDMITSVLVLIFIIFFVIGVYVLYSVAKTEYMEA